MIARGEDVELVAIARGIEGARRRLVRGRRHELVDGGVPHEERNVAQREHEVVVAAVADRRLRAREEIGELLGELERADAAHRVPPDRRPVGVETVETRDIRPHLEDVGARIAVVEAVGSARLRRDDDRAAAAVAELRLVPRAEELVVVRRERVQEERHAVTARRPRCTRHVDRVRLELALILARTVRTAARRRREAAHREVGAGGELDRAHEDAIERAGLRDAAGEVWHVVVDRCREFPEVDVGVERADVAGRERRPLVLVAPPCRRLRGTRRVGRVGHRLCVAERDVEERGGRDRGRAARMRRVGDGLRYEVASLRAVPQTDAGRESHDAGRIPRRMRHPHLDLPPHRIDCDRWRGTRRGRAGRGVDEIRHGAAGARVHGEKEIGGRTDVRAGREVVQHAVGAAERDREGDERRIVERVQRRAKRGRVGERLHA